MCLESALSRGYSRTLAWRSTLYSDDPSIETTVGSVESDGDSRCHHHVATAQVDIEGPWRA